jgi:hypothetical protein
MLESGLDRERSAQLPPIEACTCPLYTSKKGVEHGSVRWFQQERGLSFTFDNRRDSCARYSNSLGMRISTSTKFGQMLLLLP